MSIQSDPSPSLVRKAVYWALLNGIVVDNDGSSDSVVHAPISLSPYVYPRLAFDEARSLAPLFNKVVHSVAKEGNWLIKTLENVMYFIQNITYRDLLHIDSDC
jgi:glutathione synthase